MAGKHCEADLDNSGVYASGDTAVGECYNDSNFDEVLTVNGGTTVGLSNVTLSVASGQRHAGTAGTGARIVRTGTGTIITGGAYASAEFIIQWLDVNGNGQTSITAIISLSTSQNSTMRQLLLHDSVRAGAASGLSINTAALGSGTKAVNVVVYDITDTSTGAATSRGIADVSASGRTVSICNCTVDNIINNGGTGECYGVDWTDSANKTIQNCAVTNPVGTTSGTKACFSVASPGSGTVDHNLSSDTSASGTGSLTSKSASNQFVSTTNGSEDYHLKSGADAIDAGVDLVTTPTGVNFDIDNRDRDAQGDTWDIGADEYVAPVGGTQYYVIGGGVSGASGVIVGII